MNLSPSIALDDLELDALTELVNIGVGRAATSLRCMVGDEVFLSEILRGAGSDPFDASDAVMSAPLAHVAA